MPEIASLTSYIRGLAALGERPALIAHAGVRTRAVSYRGLSGRAEAFAARLRAEGIGAGERVILWGAAGPAWAIAFFGAVLAGAVVVPLDPGFSDDFCRRIGEHTGAKLICGAGAAPAWAGTRWLDFDAIEGLAPVAAPAEAPAPPAPEALLEIVYTSGTTSEPRGVMITHANLLANLRPVAREVAKYKGRARAVLPLRFLHLIPLSHLFGQVMGLFIPPLLDSAVVFTDSQSPAEWAGLLHRHRASVMVCVPRQLELFSEWALAQAGQSRSAAIAASGRRRWPVRWWHWRRLHRHLGWKMWAFIVGGASLSVELETLWSAFGYAVIQGYGLTETAPAIAITHPFHPRAGAVGRRLQGTEVRIAGDGEILVRGANVSPGYYRDAGATAAAYADGWLHTGDLGRFDADGNLVFLGRKKEVIVGADGLNVFPADVEAVLAAQPAIAEAAVVEGAQAGEVHAVLVPRDGGEGAEAAVAAANRTLEPHQRVRAFSLWPEAHLPRTLSTGKLRRAAIAAWVRGAPAAAAPGAPADWRAFLGARWGIAAARLQPSAALEADLGLSSLDRVELLNWLETHTPSARLDEFSFNQTRTVADLEALLQPAAADAAPPLPGRPAAVAEHDFSTWPLRRPARAARELARPALLALLRTAVTGLEIEGREKLGEPRPVLFICNHQSVLDVPVILSALPKAWRPRLAPAMGIDLLAAGQRRRWALVRALFNTFPLSAAGGIGAALRYAGELVDHGYAPLIFPEGARTHDGRVHAFRAGIGVFAERLGIPIVPVVLSGLHAILPPGARRPRPGRVRVYFGAPLRYAGDTPEQIRSALNDLYQDRYASLVLGGNEAPR